jgi:hypothetical protein
MGPYDGKCATTDPTHPPHGHQDLCTVGLGSKGSPNTAQH